MIFLSKCQSKCCTPKYRFHGTTIKAHQRAPMTNLKIPTYVLSGFTERLKFISLQQMLQLLNPDKNLRIFCAQIFPVCHPLIRVKRCPDSLLAIGVPHCTTWQCHIPFYPQHSVPHRLPKVLPRNETELYFVLDFKLRTALRCFQGNGTLSDQSGSNASKKSDQPSTQCETVFYTVPQSVDSTRCDGSTASKKGDHTPKRSLRCHRPHSPTAPSGHLSRVFPTFRTSQVALKIVTLVKVLC